MFSHAIFVLILKFWFQISNQIIVKNFGKLLTFQKYSHFYYLSSNNTDSYNQVKWDYWGFYAIYNVSHLYALKIIANSAIY